MKRFIILVLIALLAGASVFAMDFCLGVEQNFMNTSLELDCEGNHFGFEASFGFPFIYGTASVIDAIEDGKEIDFSDGVAMVLLPGMMVNGYWKVIDGNWFDLRLGLQGNIQAFFDNENFSILCITGLSTGFNFKFNERFGMNFTASVPLAFPVAAIAGGDAAMYTGFFFTTYPSSEGDYWGVLFGGGLFVLFSHVARLSFKWTV